MNIKLEHTNYQYMAKKILQNVGGKENVEEVENCVTRLRLELKDGSLVNEENIKKIICNDACRADALYDAVRYGRSSSSVS